MYEYHVTVRDGDISKFKDWCCMNQVKPLLIDLHRVEGAGMQKQLQFTYRSCYFNDEAVKELAVKLEADGFNICRIKCEADDPGRTVVLYWESHGLITLTSSQISKLRSIIPTFAHLSNNAFKKQVDGQLSYWITIRHKDADVVDLYINAVNIILSSNNFGLVSFKIEAVLKDTNGELDDGWK